MFTWASGNFYSGNFNEDERDGYGEMHWTDGSTYKGDWKRGIMHGKGKMILPSGEIKAGRFDNNVYYGKLQTQKPRQPNIGITRKSAPSQRIKITNNPKPIKAVQ